MKKLHGLHISLKIALTIILAVGCYAGFIGGIILIEKAEDYTGEMNMRKQVEKIPGMRVKSSFYHDLSGQVEVEIVHKGTAVIQFYNGGRYGRDPYIEVNGVGPYKTLFDCINGAGHNRTNLSFEKDAYLKKLFPFQVNALQDVVTNYDAIFSVLKTLPIGESSEDVYADLTRLYNGQPVRKINQNFVVRTGTDTSPMYCYGGINLR